LVHGKFSWQEGYGAFSYSKVELPGIIRYINHQQEHHSKKTFLEEYLGLLKEFEIEYDNRFLFKPINMDYIVPAWPSGRPDGT
jgi:putative transposase